MKLPKPRLWKIEDEIIHHKKELVKDEDEQFHSLLSKKVDISDLESAIKMVTSNRRHKIEVLELERKFIIDRQNNIFWRIVWNVIVPIIVSLTTVYIISLFK